MSPKLRVALLAFAVCFGLDVLTKYWVESQVHFGSKEPVVDGFFYITHVRNPGAAFGLFRDAPEQLRLFFFVGISLVAVGIIVSFLVRLAPGDRLSALALGMILGGALGNLRDRVRYGEVVDFLHFQLWPGFSWPDFNVADSCIVVGVGLLVLELLATEGDSPTETA